MPVANYETYCKMMDNAYKNHFAFPAINVFDMESVSGVLAGLAEAKSDGIIQMSLGGAKHASGNAVGDSVAGAIALATYIHQMAEKYNIYVAIHTDHCQADKVDSFLIPLIEATEARRAKGLPNLFSSHMFDGSALPHKENVRLAKGLLERCAKNDLILEVEAGSLFSTEGICINRSKAENLELEVGDNVEICAKTQAGEMNYYETKVTGIYSGGAFYDTYYAFIALDTAESIFEIEDGYFDVLKVFLKDLSKAEYEAEEMNRVLDNEVMTVETYSEANTFYTTMPSVIKLVCVAFTLFLLVLIAIGLRSTIRINLMQRMKEFGTIRAIGFSRMQTYGIIFTETFIISFFAFTVALTVVLALLFVVGIQGIYVGPAMSTVFGSERLYPYLNVIDVLETFGVIILFSLMATLKPGLQMCYQNITDILGMKVERIHLLRKIILQK